MEYNFPEIATYEKLVENYVNNKMSLPDIYKKYNLGYSGTKFLLNYHDLHIRNSSEGFFNCNDKRNKTNIEKYGAKNVLSKGTIIYYKRNKTVKDRYGVDNVFQIKEIIERINDDTYYLEKYGLIKKELASLNSQIMWNSLNVEDRRIFIERSNKNRNETWKEKYNGHPLNNLDVIEKIKITNKKKYGCDYFFQSNEFLENEEIQKKIKETKIKNGHLLKDINMEPFLLYKRNCRKLTNRFKKELYENWNGYDYYDNEYIKNNMNLHNTNKNYPTIDHKISIFYGFINNISEEEISSINNLCITKRSINSSKRAKNNI